MDRSVLHLDVLGDVAVPQPGLQAFDLDDGARGRLEGAVLATFARADGAPVPIPGAAYGPTDGFFEAVGRFNLLVGCNAWTAATLREAGLRTGWWTPVPLTLMPVLLRYNPGLAAP